MLSFRRLLTVLVAALLCAGCAHKRKPLVVQRPVKPWIGTKSLCIFPMAHALQHPGPDALAAAMTAGWKARLDVPDGAQLVHIEPGARAGAFEGIWIDLTDVRIDAEEQKKQKKLKPLKQSLGSMTAQRLELVANPLLLEKARLLLSLKATDARLDVRRDRRTRASMLTLTDARDGTLSLEVPRQDVDWLLLHGAKRAAGKFGVSVDRTRLKLHVEESRTIRVDLKVDTRIGFLPAGFRFRARVDIDDNLNGRMTRLSCKGDQLLGPIISSIIDPALKKYEGKTRPLVGFEWGDMKLRDVTMNTDHSFRLQAKFGTMPGSNKPQVTQKSRRRAA